jgi:hypothetical protein
VTDQPTPTTATRNPLIAIMFPSVLIAHFLLNLLTPAHELPLRAEQVMTMTFDFLTLAGLFAFRRAMPAPLFWIALVAGLGLFALRLSDDGWWTGHLVYSLPQR